MKLKFWIFLLISVPQICFAAPKVKVGFILPLSGPVSEYGVAAQNGVTLAQEEHPELFRDFEIVFDDSRYDPKSALSIFENFRTEKGVSLAYIWGYGPNQAVAPVAEAKGFPIIAISSEREIAIGKNNVVRFCYDLSQAAEKLLNYTRSKNYKSIGIVKTDIPFHNSLIEEMQKILLPSEHLEVANSFGFDDQDFKTNILKLKSKPYDVLGVFLLEGQVSQFYKQAAQLNFRPNTILTDFMESPDEVSKSGELINGAVFATHFTSPEFIGRYQARFKKTVQVPYAANAYEFAVQAARFAKQFSTPPTSKMWMDAFKGIRNAEGVIGNYTLDESSNSFLLQVVMRQIRNGSISTLVEN